MIGGWTPRARAAGFGLASLVGALIVGAVLSRGVHPTGAARPEPVVDAVAQAGARLYREGRVATGAFASARVLGDVPVVGEQIQCASCHGRSGMGVSESGKRTPPIAGPFLFAPDARARREAYTEQTLARALREGLDPSGRALDPLMPRYALADDDVAALAAYLRGLGAAPCPGVDANELRLATVIADDAPPATRDGVERVLETFVALKNADVRKEGARSAARRAPGEQFEPYRTWKLDVWRLTGPPSGWRAQLDAYYAESPVFALVSGVAAGPWGPIHVFCEDNQVPCLLPDTDRPPQLNADFYSLYYSSGLDLEARVIAAELQSSNAHADVLQLVASGDEASAEAATALAASAEARGGHSRTLALEPGPNGDAALANAVSSDVSAVVLWLGPEDLRRLPADLPASGARLIVSSTLTHRRYNDIPAEVHPRTSAVNLFRASEERDPGLDRFRAWARVHAVAITDERAQAQAWFACVALLHGVDHMGPFPGRDYLLDTLDHAVGLTALLPIYPRGSTGPGQRTLVRGGRIERLSGVAAGDWIVP